ncbi:MAG TPA: ester cyclase [Solirubrobacteraceae bacterium]|nr:ester cyclase [Solirubrobacteraceae bacterium]
MAQTEDVARRYFGAIDARDLDGLVDCWAPGGIDRFVGDQEVVAPDGVRDYFREVFAAIPDSRMEVLDVTVQDDRAAVRWRINGTFAGPGPFQGLEPTGGELTVEGFDLVRVADGRITRNDAYLNGVDVARQVGALPPRGSAGERRLNALFNRRTRVARALGGGDAEPVAEGVWVLRGGGPLKAVNVWLLEDAGGVVAFDAGMSVMARPIAAAAARLGGLRRIVLSHAHADHRGAAALLGAEVFCHPDERGDVEGDAGASYVDLARFPPPARWIQPRLQRFMDAGPVTVAGTVQEDDEVAGFRVLHTPGHAPGHIALWREADRLALAADTFFGIDLATGRRVSPRPGPDAFNWNTTTARHSMRKLAALDPATAWPSHGDPVTGDVARALETGAGT